MISPSHSADLKRFLIPALNPGVHSHPCRESAKKICRLSDAQTLVAGPISAQHTVLLPWINICKENLTVIALQLLQEKETNCDLVNNLCMSLYTYSHQDFYVCKCCVIIYCSCSVSSFFLIFIFIITLLTLVIINSS